jgi:hypothetical protein
MPTRMPRARSRPTAARVWATVIPLSMASSTVWAPDSAPSQTSAQPARCRAATFSSVIRSTRVWQRNGVRRPASAIACDQATSQRDFNPRMSSQNQRWSGA